MDAKNITFRKFPYPYKAMLAICSDLDETPNLESYLEIARYLNTGDDTRIGKGIGLEVGNTIYFDMPDEELSYWNTSADGREQIRSLIRSGHIDCFHSYGDLASDRGQVQRSLSELEAHGCRLGVWVDHAQAPTNFGADIMHGHGDCDDHPAFHADLTTEYGVRYAWLGRVTSVIGQNCRYSPADILDSGNPAASMVTMIKDVAKNALSRRSNSKYRMHVGNRLTRRVKLRSDHELTEFIRCNPHPGGVSCGETARGIAEVLSSKNLNRLISRGGCSIIYTHLGKKLVPGSLFTPDTCAAFRRLAELSHDRQVLVTTTRRLLDYDQSARSITASISEHGDQLNVSIKTPAGSDASGITFYWEAGKPRVLLNNILQKDVQLNPPDETGRPSWSIRWNPLEWPL